MRLCLIALPWSSMHRPSAALGALAAWVEREVPEAVVQVRSAFLDVAARIGGPLYERMCGRCYELGEVAYLAVLYPERRPAVVAQLARALDEPEDRVDRLVDALQEHLDELADELAGSAEVVGLTTCFGQLFANVALAQRIKIRAPRTQIVLGGSTVSARVGPSVLREYGAVDFVAQGEGERPLAALLRALIDRPGLPPGPIDGLLDRRSTGPARPAEVGRMDDLPVPQFDEYAERAERMGLVWRVPIEGSRGCWWDRVGATGDPTNTCYFCNLNVQWTGYREKSPARVVDEVAQLTERYRTGSVFFLDNILRARGIDALADGLARLGDLDFFYELRAHLRPWQIHRLWEAGLRRAQFGIEALSPSLLRRIGKGTTVLQNLEVMKACAELGIANGSNLIVDFPGSTADEVAETVHAVQRLAPMYPRLDVARFHLGMGSTVEVLRERFGIVRVRNAEVYRVGLPPQVFERLELLDRSYDTTTPGADWRPVERAVAAWPVTASSTGEAGLLTYQEGPSWVRIRDRRGPNADIVLTGAVRELFLACTSIRPIRGLAQASGWPEGEVRDAVAPLIERDLMVTDGARLLSLPAAWSREAAARRMAREGADRTLPAAVPA